MNKILYDSEKPEEVTYFNKQLNLLIEENTTSREHYNDIHIYQEECFIILEWVKVDYDSAYGAFEGKFQFVDTDQVVLKEIFMPDNSTRLVYTNSISERNDAFEEWKKDNPDCELSAEEYFND